MKSWKTTLAGFAAGAGLAIDALIQAAEAGAFTGKSGKELLIALALFALGYYSKDKNVTGGKAAQ